MYPTAASRVLALLCMLPMIPSTVANTIKIRDVTGKSTDILLFPVNEKEK